MGWLRDTVAEDGEAANPGSRRSYNPFKGSIIRVPKNYGQSVVSGSYALLFASIHPETACRYLRALFAFDYWYNVAADMTLPFSSILLDYIFWSYDTGEVAKGQCTYLLSCLACAGCWWWSEAAKTVPEGLEEIEAKYILSSDYSKASIWVCN